MNQILTDEEITLIIRECARGSAINRDGSTSHRIARSIEQAILNKLSEQKPLVPEGYQLVPIEPTKAMMWALYGHWVGQLTHLDYGYYKAMLSAARSE